MKKLNERHGIGCANFRNLIDILFVLNHKNFHNSLQKLKLSASHVFAENSNMVEVVLLGMSNCMEFIWPSDFPGGRQN